MCVCLNYNLINKFYHIVFNLLQYIIWIFRACWLMLWFITKIKSHWLQHKFSHCHLFKFPFIMNTEVLLHCFQSFTKYYMNIPCMFAYAVIYNNNPITLTTIFCLKYFCIGVVGLVYIQNIYRINCIGNNFLLINLYVLASTQIWYKSFTTLFSINHHIAHEYFVCVFLRLQFDKEVLPRCFKYKSLHCLHYA